MTHVAGYGFFAQDGLASELFLRAENRGTFSLADMIHIRMDIVALENAALGEFKVRYADIFESKRYLSKPVSSLRLS